MCLFFVRKRQKCPSDSCCSRRAWVNTKPWGGPRAMKALHANWLLWSPPFSRPQDVAFNCSPHISSKCALSYDPHTCYVTYNFPVLCLISKHIWHDTETMEIMVSFPWCVLACFSFQMFFVLLNKSEVIWHEDETMEMMVSSHRAAPPLHAHHSSTHLSNLRFHKRRDRKCFRKSSSKFVRPSSKDESFSQERRNRECFS